MKSYFRLLSLSILLTFPLLAQEAARAPEAPEIPFHLPTPEGWRTETIPLPLEFAPEIELTGLEELRFAPGMFKEGADDFWTYVFVWWIPEDSVLEEDMLARSFNAYFRGLSKAVGEPKGIDFEGVEFRAVVGETPKKGNATRRFEADILAFDAFVTSKPINLEAVIDVLECPGKGNEKGNLAAIFSLSPQPREHSVWAQLAEIADGFRCSPAP